MAGVRGLHPGQGEEIVMAAFRRMSLIAASFAGAALFGPPAPAQDYESAIAQIREELGFVPSFVQTMPETALPGAWSELMALEESDVLDAKVKALIEIAV